MLTYDFKHREAEQIIVTQSLNNNMPIPDFILNAPELNLGNKFYYDAFIALTTTRPIGFGGVGQIPWTAIREYFKMLNIDEDDFYEFYRIISLVDNAYLKLVNTN